MMNSIKIKSQIEEWEYIKLIFQLSYTRPSAIFSMILTAGILTNSLFINQYSSYQNKSLWIGIAVVYFVVRPIGIYLVSKKGFDSNKMIREAIEYEFTADEMKIKGETFSSNINWENCYKISETKKWILIYQSRSVANFIPKDSFDGSLEQFKGLLRSKSPNIKVNLKK